MKLINKIIFALFITFLFLINNLNAYVSFDTYMSLPSSAKQTYLSARTSGLQVSIVSNQVGQTVLVTGANTAQLSDRSSQASNSNAFSSTASSLITNASNENVNLTSNTATSAACANGAGVYLVSSSSSSSSSRSYSSPSPAPAAAPAPPPPPPPPPPSCSYVSSWTINWSVCNLNGEWDNNGNINCKQDIVSTTANYTNLGQRTCPSNASRPTSSKEVTLNLDYNTSNCQNKYANGVDKCDISFNLTGIPSEGVSGFDGLDTKNILFEGGYLNQITNNGEKGIDFINGTINSNVLNLQMTSVVPFNNTGKFEFDIKGKSQYAKVIFQNFNIKIKKPFIGFLEIDELNGIPEVDREMKVGSGYILTTKIQENSTLNKNIITLSNLDNININNGYIANNKNLLLNNKLDFILNYGSQNILPGLKNVIISQLPYTSYNLKGKNVKYILSMTDNPTDNNGLIYNVKNRFLGVSIIGKIQGQGKQEITGQILNISDILKSGLRNIIRSNAYKYIKSMNSGQKVGGVKYIEGDYEISGDLPYETLVINNGNLTISGDLNPSHKKLGIIVLKDNFNIKNIQEYGNIVVKGNVKNINALIYSDGGLIPDDIPSYKQLKLNGSLFTRNTIGGSIGNNNTFILPGGEITDNYELAKKYDLNNIRIGNNLWDYNNDNIENNGEIKNASFIIKYNPLFSINTPKLFGK